MALQNRSGYWLSGKAETEKKAVMSVTWDSFLENCKDLGWSATADEYVAFRDYTDTDKDGESEHVFPRRTAMICCKDCFLHECVPQKDTFSRVFVVLLHRINRPC
jgi:hypothetical protein